MSATHGIDVVVVNFHCSDHTLAAVAPWRTWCDGAVVVVDNSADAHEEARLARGLAGSAVRLLRTGRNLGFGQGCEHGAAAGRADFVLFLNPDARMTPAEAMTLRAAMASPGGSSRGWGALAPLVYWDEAHRFVLPSLMPETPLAWVGTALLGRNRRLATAAFRAYRRWQRSLMGPGRAHAVDFLSGGVLMVRREAAQAAGGFFDPAYFMFYEDADLCRRLRRGGWGLGVVAQATAVHHWRHGEHKSTLMGQAQAVYRARHFAGAVWPPLERWLAGHRDRRGVADLGSVTRPDALAQGLGDARLAALSMSPVGMPAILPADDTGASTDELLADAWMRLANGAYWAVTEDSAGRLRWHRFEKAAAAPQPMR